MMTLKLFTVYLKKISINCQKKLSFRIKAKIGGSEIFDLTPSSRALRLNKVKCDYGFTLLFFLQATELRKAEAEIWVKTQATSKQLARLKIWK